MSTAALIVAAGRGVRFGSETPKQFALLGDKPLLFHSIEIFQSLPELDEIWLVLPKESVTRFERRFDLSPYTKIAGFGPGGKRRQDSVLAGLMAMPERTEIVAIHDAVRPFAAPEAISKAIARARKVGAAILARPVVDTPKRCDARGRVIETLDRRELWLAETPQVFRYELIRHGYEQVTADRAEVTDDAAAVERLGHPVGVVASPSPNPKITNRADIRFAEWLLSEKGRE